MFIQPIDLGPIPYEPALAIQREHHARVLGERDANPDRAPAGVLLLLEHKPPVITVTKRKDAPRHILASQAALDDAGIELRETDRGGDVTYHGPGQLVAYPILDLNRLNLRLHAYMRALENAVIETCARFGLAADRDTERTGVWIDKHQPDHARKICALGVRIRQWVTMHGLALNVNTNLDHFRFIVPCGIHDRGVTSIRRELGAHAPDMPAVKRALAQELAASLGVALGEWQDADPPTLAAP